MTTMFWRYPVDKKGRYVDNVVGRGGRQLAVCVFFLAVFVNARARSNQLSASSASNERRGGGGDDISLLSACFLALSSLSPRFSCLPFCRRSEMESRVGTDLNGRI